MNFVLAGLGNPGEEYTDTRHNIGRMVVEEFARTYSASEWKRDVTTKTQKNNCVLGGNNVLAVLPETFMNRSGTAIAPLVSSEKALERLAVVHDDIDLPFGTLRIVFNRGAGGHRGVASIERAVKSSAFVRVRVGVSPVTPSGKLKKPRGEQAVLDFILGTFTKKEQNELPAILSRAACAVAAIIVEGRTNAMNEYNGEVPPSRAGKRVRTEHKKSAAKK